MFLVLRSLNVKKKKKVVNIDDEEESVNEELILQDGEYNNNIDLNGID